MERSKQVKRFEDFHRLVGFQENLNDEIKMEDPQQPPVENVLQKRMDLSIRRRICQFLNNTGCHGCNKLVQTSYPRRYIWACLILSSTGFLFYTVVKEFQDFYSYPTFTKFNYELVEEMRFPAVTICNISPYNQKKIDLHNEDPKYKTDMLHNNMHLKTFDVNQTRVTVKEFTDHMWVTAYDLNRFIFYVEFDSTPLNVSNSITKTTTNLGPCFAFNSDGKTTTRVSGRKQNLAMDFNIDQMNYTNNAPYAGILISIEDPGHTPDILNLGTMVPPGVSAEIRMTKEESKFLPYPYKMRDGSYCINSRDPNYSKKRCMDACVARAILDACHCTIVEDLIDGPVCSISEMSSCYNPVRAQIKGNASFNKDCRCKESCKTTVYKSKISMSQYPSEVDVLKKIPPDADDDMQQQYTAALRNNLLNVRIYFDHLRKTTIDQVPKYDSVTDVLANLGGQMGLFLGISVLTVVEFGEMLVLVLCTVIEKVLYQRHQITPSRR